MTKLFVIFFFILSGALQAQNLYNESVISIGPSSVIYVKDTIINEGTIINNGDMQVGGSWINNSVYDAGQGQISFNSDARQIINHNDQSFSRLTISGGGEKLFLADITIENDLDLTDGILVSEDNSRIIFSPSAQVTGGSDVSHIQGPVYHQGEGHKVFHVGNGTEYLPVELLNIQGTSAEIGLTLHELDGTLLPTSPSVTAISTDRYWEVDVVSGSLNNSVVILPVRNESVVTNPEEVVVAQTDDLLTGFESLGQSQFTGTASDGKVTSDNIVSQKFLAVGTASVDGQLIVFNAVSANGDDLNAYLRILNIQNYPKNTFTVFNRWSDKVFEIEDYDNEQRVFRGKSNLNGEKDLVNGTYFYVIETQKDRLRLTGFLMLKN